MKTKYREALVLHYIEEKPYKEISDILRVPMGTVGTLIARGKNMLRAICQRKGGNLIAFFSLRSSGNLEFLSFGRVGLLAFLESFPCEWVTVAVLFFVGAGVLLS